MSRPIPVTCWGLCSVLMSLVTITFVQGADTFADSLLFYASLDSDRAELSGGDSQLQTAETLERKRIVAGLPKHVSLEATGRWGKCLRFHDVSPEVVMFRGKGNLPYSSSGFGLTISFWLRVDPEHGLKPGYVDPLQITDKAWNDASLFVDFTKDETPRHFRLGVFSDLKHWNPNDTAWDDVSEADRPMVVVRDLRFASDRWTHVVLTLENANADKPGPACLYLDGKQVGTITRDFRLSWRLEDVAIMLGIQYIGDMDDFSVFRRALSDGEVNSLFALPHGVGPLVPR